MVYESLEKYLESLTLTFDLQVLAGLALGLAASFDKDGNTSTAAELRKTVLEIKRQVDATTADFDPLESMLTRAVSN
jgi:hypothetical protein